MGDSPLSFRVLPVRLAVLRLDPRAPVPQPPPGALFWACTLTEDELSIVCEPEAAQVVLREGPYAGAEVRVEGGFRAIKVAGPLDFALVGVLSRLLSPLAAAGIPALAISTFDTDYLLIREGDLTATVSCLRSVAALEDPPQR